MITARTIIGKHTRFCAACLLLLTTGLAADQQEPPDCEAMVARADYEAIELIGESEANKEANRIEALQKLLKANGFLTDQVDKKVGPQTRQALVRLCRYLDVIERKKIQASARETDSKQTSPAEDQVAEDPVKKEAEAKKAEARAKKDEAAAKKAEAEAKAAEAEATEAEAQAQQTGSEESRKAAEEKRTEAAVKKAEAEAKRAEAEVSRADADAMKVVQEPVKSAAEIANWLYRGLLDLSNGIGLENQVNLDGGGCGCSRDFSAMVYGFYPYWLADGGLKTVDFSLLDRIGFLALRLDEKGLITNEVLWKAGGDADPAVANFIRAAVRHKVRVDVTYHMSDWMNWDENGAIMKTAVDEIAESAMQTFSGYPEGRRNELHFWLRKLLPFVEDNSTVYADGINLYFDGYEKAEHADRLKSLVKKMRAKLKDKRPDLHLNIILGLNWSGINRTGDAAKVKNVGHVGKELFSELEPVLTGKTPIEFDADGKVVKEIDTVNNVLLFLPQNVEGAERNTSTSKKLLRRIIEDAFDGNGAGRRGLLRKTIPIITTLPSAIEFDTDYFEADKQFKEDLIYLEDNFAGAGLWPMPYKPAEEGAEISGPEGPVETEVDKIRDRLIEELGISGESGFLGGYIEEQVDKLCEFACPNRLQVRVTYDFLLGVLLIYGLLALGDCRLREFYQKRFYYFYGWGFATAMVILVSLVCDPFLKEYSSYISGATLFTLFGYIVLRKVRHSMQPKLP